MPKQAKFLVATDTRLPLTVALAYAFAENKISPELLTIRKRELTELVSEAAKTFGFQSKTTLTSAFDISVGLLSLALASGTRGEILPDQWTDRLVNQSWKGLVKEAIAIVRTVNEQDAAYAYLFEIDQDPRILRDHLRNIVSARDRHQQWIGFATFIRYRDERLQLQTTDTLVRWLIKSLVKRPLFWMKDPIEGPSSAEEALNTLLFRASTGLGFNQKDIVLTEKEFRQVRAEYDDDAPSWLKLGQARYEALLNSIPKNLRDVTNEKWFHHRLGKGPPNVKKWQSHDLRGITGFYYYETSL